MKLPPTPQSTRASVRRGSPALLRHRRTPAPAARPRKSGRTLLLTLTRFRDPHHSAYSPSEPADCGSGAGKRTPEKDIQPVRLSLTSLKWGAPSFPRSVRKGWDTRLPPAKRGCPKLFSLARVQYNINSGAQMPSTGRITL